MSDNAKIDTLKKKLASIEQRFELLRVGGQVRSVEWDEVGREAGLVRMDLFSLTGDYYPKGRKASAFRPGI
jgi:hypothetical protein